MLISKGIELLGLDAYGVDYRTAATRSRVEFEAVPALADAAKAALARVLKNLWPRR